MPRVYSCPVEGCCYQTTFANVLGRHTQRWKGCCGSAPLLSAVTSIFQSGAAPQTQQLESLEGLLDFLDESGGMDAHYKTLYFVYHVLIVGPCFVCSINDTYLSN